MAAGFALGGSTFAAVSAHLAADVKGKAKAAAAVSHATERESRAGDITTFCFELPRVCDLVSATGRWARCKRRAQSRRDGFSRGACLGRATRRERSTLSPPGWELSSQNTRVAHDRPP